MNDTIIIAYSNQTNLGIPMNYYNWQGIPMWQYVYQRFSNLECSKIFIIGLDTLDTELMEKSIHDILLKEKALNVLLFDMSLVMVTDKTLNYFIDSQKAIVATSYLKNPCYDYLNQKTFFSNEMCSIEPLQKYNRQNLLEIYQQNKITNINQLFECYKLKHEILFKELSNDEKTKLITKRDARVINFLKS